MLFDLCDWLKCDQSSHHTVNIIHSWAWLSSTIWLHNRNVLMLQNQQTSGERTDSLRGFTFNLFSWPFSLTYGVREHSQRHVLHPPSRVYGYSWSFVIYFSYLPHASKGLRVIFVFHGDFFMGRYQAYWYYNKGIGDLGVPQTLVDLHLSI